MSNIKSDIINNITVTMSVYIRDREVLDVLELVLANEFMKVNVEEITTLPAEVKSSVDQRNAYLVQLFMIQKRHLKKRTWDRFAAWYWPQGSVWILSTRWILIGIWHSMSSTRA